MFFHADVVVTVESTTAWKRGSMIAAKVSDANEKQRFWIGRITEVRDSSVAVKWFDAENEFGYYREHKSVGDVHSSLVITQFANLTTKGCVPESSKRKIKRMLGI